MRWLHIIPCAALAATLAAGCDGTPVDPRPDDVGTPSFSAVVHDAWVETWAITDQDVWMDCANDGQGEPTDWSGTIDIYYRSRTTPSGNVTTSWKVDYYTATPLSFTGDNSGDLWQLYKAEDNGGSVSKPKGTQYTEHWQFNEFYKNQDGDKMHSRVRYQMLVDADGNVKLDRFDVRCN
jgi:hypothetical protein